MAINKTLKFSWGHIIAFVALIFVSYVTFMGVSYLSQGNFWYAGASVVAVDFILTIFFIIPQILKGADEKFSKKIVFERILFFATPIFFIAAMIPYAHFWTVFDNRSEIETTFAESVKGIKGMFSAYEDYAHERINVFEKKLADSVVSARTPASKSRKGKAKGAPGVKPSKGHSSLNSVASTSLAAKKPKAKKGKKPNSQKPAFSKIRQANAVEALKLQLIGQNYYDLQSSAETWIDNAAEATVWNVFTIGNIDTIEEVMDNWNHALYSFSSKTMKDEDKNTIAFSENDESVVTAKKSLRALRAGYTQMGGPTLLSIGTALLLYFMLLFPYLIQSRNTKNTFRLIGCEGDSGRKPRKENYRKNKRHNRVQDDELETFVVEDSVHNQTGDYDSFSM